MTRINTNVSSLIAVNNLNKNNTSLQTSLQRLSTGYRINSGKDDPAGLIASQNLQAEQAGTASAISNAQNANNVIGTAEGALGEVSNLLISLQGLVNNSANTGALSQDEKNANQLQVDSILSTVNRISNSTTFQGTNLLNGSLAYATSGLATTSAFTSVQINSATLVGTPLSVTVKVITSAQTGRLSFLGNSGGLTSAVSISVAGNTGTVQLSFASATKSSAIVAAVNHFTNTTGVTATLSAQAIRLTSTGYGASQFVSVTSNSAAFSTQNIAGSAQTTNSGADAALTVNGTAVTSNGLNVRVVTANLDAAFTLNANINLVGMSKSFGVTGGGATFSLGAQVNQSSQASIGINAANTSSLGTTMYQGKVYTLSDLGSGKFASVNTGDTNLAQAIVTQAISDVSQQRGRLGAFQSNVLQTTIDSLNVALENVASANSTIQDTNFASETAALTRAQILSQAATSVLSQANQAPQAVLKLLG